VFGSFTPDKAVDGTHDGWALKMSSSCFVSEADNNPWWIVKLQEARLVFSPKFWSRCLSRGFGLIVVVLAIVGAAATIVVVGGGGRGGP